MQKWTRKAAAVIAVICLAFGTAGVVMHKWDEMRQEKAQEELTAQVVGMSEAGTTGETMPEKKVPEVENEIGETNAIKETEYVSAIDFSALDFQNPDVVAWIQIPGTQINYPVVQGKDNDYYLHRDLNGQKSTASTIFLDYADQADFSSLHNVLYGHHMNNGTMFADLCKYESEDFYQEHKTVRFDTLSGFGEYEVVAVFKTVAYSEQGFKYYHFTSAESEADFDDYIAQCKALSLYDTGVTAEYGDKLITLSTCEYSRKNGRMVVVAKRIAAPSAEVGSDA